MSVNIWQVFPTQERRLWKVADTLEEAFDTVDEKETGRFVNWLVDDEGTWLNVRGLVAYRYLVEWVDD